MRDGILLSLASATLELLVQISCPISIAWRSSCLTQQLETHDLVYQPLKSAQCLKSFSCKQGQADKAKKVLEFSERESDGRESALNGLARLGHAEDIVSHTSHHSVQSL